MAYLYIHIPLIFPAGFFEESQLIAALISRKIRSRGSVTKWCLSTDTPSVISQRRHEQTPVHEVISSINYKISG